MIGLDTNILLRAVTNDDPVQTPMARRLLRGLAPNNQGVINVVVLMEFVWNLRRSYGYGRLEVADVVETLLRSEAYIVTERSAVNSALGVCRSTSMNFPDALIGEINRLAGCTTTMTFDKDALVSSAFSPVP